MPSPTTTLSAPKVSGSFSCSIDSNNRLWIEGISYTSQTFTSSRHFDRVVNLTSVALRVKNTHDAASAFNAILFPTETIDLDYSLERTTVEILPCIKMNLYTDIPT